ncbi:MAG: hypothetical protein ACX931_09400 [Saccharospirillum sp.]|jgi:type II secretory pathway component PulJ
MTAQSVQHSDYQQLASRIAELNATLKAMETQLHRSDLRSTNQAKPANADAIAETPLAIAAG